MTKRVLIVDDSPTVLMLHGIIVKDAGYEVITAKNGQEGVDVALREKPDAILLDLIMPVMDGLSALRILRSRPETEKTPIVVVTTRSEEKYAASARALGCNGFLLKPFNREALATTLHRVVEHAAATGTP